MGDCTTPTKVCTKCGDTKTLGEFSRHSYAKDGLRSECRVCTAARQAAHYAAHREERVAYRAAHREQIAATAAAYRSTRREEIAASRREQRYGIPPGEWDAMLATQGSGCAICGTTEPGGRGAWHTDHDHKSGTVRGILCHHCNTGLGYFGDDSDRLIAASEYLAQATGAREVASAR